MLSDYKRSRLRPVPSVCWAAGLAASRGESWGLAETSGELLHEADNASHDAIAVRNTLDNQSLGHLEHYHGFSIDEQRSQLQQVYICPGN